MTFPYLRTSSVIRWLLVVVGCAVLETAQPAFAAEAEPPPEAREESVIYPRGADLAEEAGSAESEPQNSISWLTTVFGVAMIGAGGWFLWRKKQGGLARVAGRKIQIEETRPMGNRQYLVVAQCEGRRFLLGITPGRIDVVSPLDSAEAPE